MAKSIEKQPYILPGEYTGKWSAYYVKVLFHNGNESESIELDDGIRGVNCKCKIIVDQDGWVYAI